MMAAMEYVQKEVALQTKISTWNWRRYSHTNFLVVASLRQSHIVQAGFELTMWRLAMNAHVASASQVLGL